MRLYLSSYRLGAHPERLLELCRDPGPAVVIANALDAAPAGVRAATVDRERAALRLIGIEAAELDLREYFGSPDRFVADLARHRLVWVLGGNVFVLRHALALSGADEALSKALWRDELVYAGYSAGCCVLAPDLSGLDLVDDPAAVRDCYGAAARWDGLALLDHAIVPHYRSDHPESADVELVAVRYRADGVRHRTLRDGEAIVIDN